MSQSSPYDAFDDPYCYPDSFVLKNIPDIRDAVKLSAFETEMATLRAIEPLPDGIFNPEHYQAVHHHLFQDVYRWAGAYRTVRTSKDGSTFCYPEHIEDQMEKLFGTLRKEQVFNEPSKTKFVTFAAEFLAELNAIHPFREGNGRSQLAFLFILGEQAGHPLDMERVRPEPMLNAMIQSFHGEINPLVVELTHLTLVVT